MIELGVIFRTFYIVYIVIGGAVALYLLYLLYQVICSAISYTRYWRQRRAQRKEWTKAIYTPARKIADTILNDKNDTLYQKGF